MANSVLNENEIHKKLLDIVAKEGMVDRKILKLDAELTELQIESADFVMILMVVEEEFDVYFSFDNELTDLKTVGDLLSVVTNKIIEHNLQAAS